jgi:methoxymalonate biosynthesis acyl carrier protein
MNEAQLTDYFKSVFSVEVGPDEDLFALGLIDSFNILELIDFLERSTNVRVDPYQITTENFATVQNIIRTLKF